MVRRFAHSPFGVAVIAATVMELAILVASPLRAAATKGVFALLVFVAVVAVGHGISRGRWTRAVAVLAAALVAVTALARSAGPFEVAGGRTWIGLRPGMTVASTLYSRPDSKRWGEFDRAAVQPFVFFPMTGIEDGQGSVRLKVNEVDFGPVDKIPGLRRYPLAYAVPLSWEMVTRSPWIRLEFTVEGGDAVRMFTAAQVARGWFQNAQTVSFGPERTTTMSFLRMQSEFVAEIRFSDAAGRVLAILY